MAQLPPLPGTGNDRHTGHPLAGFAHVQQSLEVIFTTHFGERVLRRWFGSFVPKLLGEPMVPSTVLRFFTAVCTAIDLWEPRYKVQKIVPQGSPEGDPVETYVVETDGLMLDAIIWRRYRRATPGLFEKTLDIN